MPVTVVPTSLATVAIDTFITELSSVIRNWPDAKVSRTMLLDLAADATPMSDTRSHYIGALVRLLDARRVQTCCVTAIEAPRVRLGTSTARWTIAATVLGSGMAFLDGTVVNVALPSISDDLGTSVTGLQWIVNAYLVTLSALLLLGGSLGDRYGHRAVFVCGAALFTAASVLCGLAPSSEFLIAARTLQGVGGALLIPGSLAIIAATFHPDDRGRAIGAWSGLAGVASSIGPFFGGWLIDAVSWRLVFLINVPLAAATMWISLRHVPETRSSLHTPLDIPGAALITLALASISYAAIDRGNDAAMVAGVIGATTLVAFLIVEHRSRHPMLPLTLFRSPQFTGTNLTTFAVYGGLAGAMFLLVLRLQVSLDYSALQAGASLVPLTVLVLLLSPYAGQLGQRIGARIPLTVGPIVAGVGVFLLSRVDAGDSYVSDVLPGVMVLGTGMAITVAPLTAAVLGSVGVDLAGVASGVNNAVARFAGMLAVAALPGLAGFATSGSIADSIDSGYETALRIAAVCTALGGVIAMVLVDRTADVRPTAHPDIGHACYDAALAVRHDLVSDTEGL
jgi:EmrB/QacA subfamily drug resistance transporter